MSLQFLQLPSQIQATVRDLMENHFESNTCELYSQDFEDIECKSRDGFICASHNQGGLILRGFTDLNMLWGTGNSPSHKGAAAEIERQIEYNLKLISEDLFKEYAVLFKSLGLGPDKANYSALEDLVNKHPELDAPLTRIQDMESNYMGDDDSSIMFEVRFMYHGLEDGKHTASVSAAVNTEGPYHRSHISWAPTVFCEGSEELEITWSTPKELAVHLDAALNTTTTNVL